MSDNDGIDPKLRPVKKRSKYHAIDALTTAIPVILRYSESEPGLRNEKVLEAIGVIRNTNRVEPYAIHLSDLIVKVINGGDLRANT